MATFGSTQYVNAAVTNVEEHLAKGGQSLPAKVLTPLLSEYMPEVDVSNELSKGEASYNHLLIDVLCWIVELGSAYICCEVPMMLAQLTQHRVGYM